jgi:hypothetical protein
MIGAKPILKLILLPLLALIGGIGQEEVLLVTLTNVGINLDSKPPSIDIGYGRDEGYLGPSYQNGALPPVLARLESNLSVFSPEVHQVYATGNASELLAEPSARIGASRPLYQNSKKVAYFATESSVGLRVTFTSSVPDSVHFGYRRKEFSFIPIGTGVAGNCSEQNAENGRPTSDAIDCYGSVLATIDVGTNVGEPQHTNMALNQLFATGRVAELLAASNETMRREFGQRLGITEQIKGEGSCDPGCQKIQAFLVKFGDTGKATITSKCMVPANINSITVFLRSATYQEARQNCAKMLPA